MERYYDKYGYANGYLERKAGGLYHGDMVIEGVDVSPIVGTFFKDEGENYLWLRRQSIFEYNLDTGEYVSKTPRPMWQVYLKEQKDKQIAYRGSFIFFHFKFNIVGIWDNLHKYDKLVFFVERAAREEQSIINEINKKR